MATSPESKPAVERTKRNFDYTAFDRKLIRAQIDKSEVVICTAKPVWNALTSEWTSMFATKMVSIDRDFIEVFFPEANTNVWLAKSNIVSATILEGTPANEIE